MQLCARFAAVCFRVLFVGSIIIIQTSFALWRQPTGKLPTLSDVTLTVLDMQLCASSACVRVDIQLSVHDMQLCAC